MASRSTSSQAPVRIGIIGYGFIGRALAARIQARPQSVALAFVHCRRRAQAVDIRDEHFLRDLAQFSARGPDLVVETAHPQITRDHGVEFLSTCDYLPLSTSALIDDVLLQALVGTTRQSGNRLFLPSGALIGGDELSKRTTPWKRARITFRKHPKNIDFSESGIDPSTIKDARVLFDGSVREIARMFPRNVNTMVTAALLSTGLDSCEGVLVADPGLEWAIAEVEAWGTDDSYIRTEKRQPVVGVSGTEMVDSIWYSVLRACGVSTAQPELV